DRMSRHFRRLLEAALSQPARAIDDLDFLLPDERAAVLRRWNASEAEFPRDRCVHELIAEQARRTPDAVAVVLEDHPVSYGDLDRRANAIARTLRGRGVGRGAFVGLCVERSAEMVIGLLGILKSGAAYVPLDPAFPKDRLALALGDT